MTNTPEAAIRQTLKEHLGLDPERAQTMPLSTDLSEDLDADSLDVIEVCMSLEDLFGISLPDTVTDRISTLGDLIAEVSRQTGKFS